MGGTALMFIGAVLCWISIYSVRDEVNYTAMPGLRTPTTLRSRATWLAAHRRIARLLWGSGVVGMLLGAAFVVWSSFGTGGGELATVVALLAFMPVVVVVHKVGTAAALKESGGR